MWKKRGYQGDYADYLRIKENGKDLKIFMCGHDLSLDSCPDCGSVADYLCDFPVGKSGRTCDRRMCAEHAHQVGEDMHYCDTHYKEWQAFRRTGTGREAVSSRVLIASNDDSEIE